MTGYIGEIRMFAGVDANTPGPNWFLCDGKEYSATTYSALGSLIGTLYGGTPGSTFNVPDLRTYMPMGAQSNGSDVGQKRGTWSEQMTVDTMPAHTHPVINNLGVSSNLSASVSPLCSNDFGSQNTPESNYPSVYQESDLIYSNGTPTNQLAAASYSVSKQLTVKGSVTCVPSGQNAPTPILNMQPVLGVYFYICWNGIYPNPQELGAESGNNDIIGEIKLFGSQRIPQYWNACDGSMLSTSSYQALVNVIGTLYGGNNLGFNLPNMTGKVAIGVELRATNPGQTFGSSTKAMTGNSLPQHIHNTSNGLTVENTLSFYYHPLCSLQSGTTDAGTGMVVAQPSGNNFATAAEATSTMAAQPVSITGNPILYNNLAPENTGNSAPMNNIGRSLVVSYAICSLGTFPQRDSKYMSGYIGEIRLWSGYPYFIPTNWMLCDGSTLNNSSGQYSSLFSLIGVNYGGTGPTSFAIPNLNSRAVVGTGTSATNDVTIIPGQQVGETYNTLTIQNLPSHSHALSGTVTMDGGGVNLNTGPACTTETGDNHEPAGAIYATVDNGIQDYGAATANSGVMGVTEFKVNGDVNITGDMGLGAFGSSSQIDNRQPSLAMYYIICVEPGDF